MRPSNCLMLSLLLAASLSLGSACASWERVTPIFPPSADLRVQPKPVLAPEAIASEAALDAHEIALETWGAAGWLTVGRICRWAKDNGAEVSCSAR